MAVLQTRRLTLSPCCPADQADFIALERDPEVMRFLNGGRPIDREANDTGSDFLMPNGTEPYVWTARHTANGAFVGWFCLWPDDPKTAELGFRLRRMEWGNGFATEGASALFGWGFKSGGYDRITATTMAVNQASRRVMDKLGMRYSRTVHADYTDTVPGSEQGDVWYEVTRMEWQAPASPAQP